MSEKSIAIIGAGIAGLAAGCYGRMNGYRTRIFEMHNEPGGLCTSWRRGDYTFDGCLHWLVGSREGRFHNYWREVGALAGAELVDFDWFFAYEPDRLRQQLLELAPEDAGEIKQLARAVERAASFDLPGDKPPELYSLGDGLKAFAAMLPYLRLFSKFGRITLDAIS
jgi:phytoene dehydrogenase-like protein